MAIANRSSHSYRPDIDGLRAIAILSVVLYHAAVPGFSGGFTGVDIFFVISGYLIGGHIFSELRAGNFSFLRFYQRRAKRILPAFYGVLAFSFVAAIVILSPSEATRFAKTAIASTLSASNIYFARHSGYFDANSELNPLLMTWSLGVEEQFYAVIPLLIFLLARVRRSLVLPSILAVCILSFGFAWIELGVHPSTVFYGLPSRAWELGIGVALAVGELSRGRSLVPARWTQAVGLLGLALIAAPVFLLTSTTAFPGPAALPSVLGTALVIASPSSLMNRRLLSLPPLTFIGRVSYSWYLWHWPLLAFVRVAESGAKLSPTAGLLIVALSFVIAVLSYYLIEQPFRNSSRAPIPLLLRYGAVSIVFLAVCATLAVKHGFPKRYPALMEHGEVDFDPCLANYGEDRPNLSARCGPDSDPRPAVLLWGDSHAAALAPALRSIANGRGYDFIELAKASCPPLSGAAKLVPLHPKAVGECIAFNNAVLKFAAADRRIRIAILAARWGDPFRAGNEYPLLTNPEQEHHLPSAMAVRSTFLRTLGASIESLKRDSVQVIVIDDVPNFDRDPTLMFAAAHIRARSTLAGWLDAGAGERGWTAPSNSYDSASSVSADLIRQTVKGLSDVEFIELRTELCDSQGQCQFVEHNHLLYSDGQHLTAEGSRYALRAFHLPASSSLCKGECDSSDLDSR